MFPFSFLDLPVQVKGFRKLVFTGTAGTIVLDIFDASMVLYDAAGATVEEIIGRGNGFSQEGTPMMAQAIRKALSTNSPQARTHMHETCAWTDPFASVSMSDAIAWPRLDVELLKTVEQAPLPIAPVRPVEQALRWSDGDRRLVDGAGRSDGERHLLEQNKTKQNSFLLCRKFPLLIPPQKRALALESAADLWDGLQVQYGLDAARASHRNGGQWTPIPQIEGFRAQLEAEGVISRDQQGSSALSGLARDSSGVKAAIQTISATQPAAGAFQAAAKREAESRKASEDAAKGKE